VTLVLVVVLGAVLSLLAVTLLDTVVGEAQRSARGVSRSASFEAAEAGIGNYTAKLVDDSQFYLHYVHPGESTRRDASGTTVAPGSTWTAGATWTYPNGKDAWRSLGNGYEYNLQVYPPDAGSEAVRVIASGRRIQGATDQRVVEARIRPSSITDFQMLANTTVQYGSAATTYGKIYAGIDASGYRHHVVHYGTAYGDIYAEGSVYGSPNMQNGARTYNGSTIRTVIKNPANFGSFITSLVDIQRAATYNGVYLNDPSVEGWRITLQSNGRFLVQPCTRDSGRDFAEASPICGAATTYTVPANGAVYAPQTVIVSGQVNGRFTVASNDDVVVAADISYVTSGDDVLGLVAQSDVLIAQYAPNNLTWRAATIAQTGAWRSWRTDGSHNRMTFTGSTATNLGGYMAQFRARVYQYDATLAYLQPPWFPTVEEAYTVQLFRELPA